MTKRTERILAQLELLTTRIDAATKGSVSIDFAGDSLVIRLVEIIETTPRIKERKDPQSTTTR